MRRTAIAATSAKYRRSATVNIDELQGKATSIPAPTWGWDAITPVANMKPDHALQLDNFIPRPGYVEIRRGSAAWSTDVGSATSSVESLMIYNGVTSSKMFSAAGTVIYDSTNTGSASSVVTGMSNARWQYVNFTNDSSAHYLVAVNGSDVPRLYDGSAWSAMSVTGDSISLGTIVQVQAFKGRLWLIPKNSTKVYYLDLGVVTGVNVAHAFELGKFMTRGGEIMAMATWSIDTRQTIDDYAVFITSTGQTAQAIVYAGTDPSTADTWALVGVYDIGPPIGRRCYINVGGDLGIICVDGILPMSQVLSTDRTAANRVSISANILNEFLSNARLYKGNFGWEMTKYPIGMLAILNVPTTQNAQSVQFVMNTLTGAWCRFTGINANCWAVFNDIPFFGDNTGTVRQFDVGSSDSGVAITATLRTSFNYFNDRNHRKKFNMLRPLLITNGSAVTPGIGLNTDFSSNASVTTPIAVNY